MKTSHLKTPLVVMFLMALCITARAVPVFINEIHYDNISTDTGEAIEIAGPAGTDLSGWSLVLYNGNNSEVYDTVNLSGVIPNHTNGFGFLYFPRAGIQNGNQEGTQPDGIALVNSDDTVVQFLSYEGTFTAADGPAMGMTSVDIGVLETFPYPDLPSHSLQLMGTGSDSSAFTWADPIASTFGAVNTGQTFVGDDVDIPPTISGVSPVDMSTGVPYGENIVVTFSEEVDVTGQWFTISGSVSGNLTATVSGGLTEYTINPDTDFMDAEVITVTIHASQVSDTDGDPDALGADYEWSFTVFKTIVFDIDPVPLAYYASAEGATGLALKSALHDIIDDHTIVVYDDVDEAYELLDLDPQNQNNLILIYSGASEPFSGFPDTWNREHLWPRSRGIDDTGADTSDLFNLYPAYSSVNSTRSNLLFDESNPGDGGYMAPGSYSLAPGASSDADSWEPPDEVKGQIARALFYMAVRYDGSDSQTKDLELNNNPDYDTGAFIPEMGILDTLLNWNRLYPVTDTERLRNQRIYNEFQFNRNPFVDFPEFVDAIFTSNDFITEGSWKTEYFTLAELVDPDISGMDADPDGDGVPNLLELALVMNPKQQDRELLPSITLNESGLPEISYERLASPSLSRIVFTIEYTDDLSAPDGGWTVLELSQDNVEEDPNGMMTSVVITDTEIDFGAAPNRLYRLMVKQN